MTTQTYLTYRDPASLSSGTIAKLITEAGLEYGYRCRHYWVIDQYQSRFAWFCNNCDVEANNWMEAWDQFVRNIRRLRNCFQSGYQGETDYVIDGKRYACRHHALPHVQYNGDYFERGIIKHLGCIRRSPGCSDGFPPNDVIAAFPGYCPLTATFDWGVDDDGDRCVTNWQYVYHDDFGKPPEHIVLPYGDYVTPMAHIDWDRIDYDTEIKPYRHR